jgi:hypothetical protein
MILSITVEFIPLYLYPRNIIDNPPSIRSGYLTSENESLNRALGCILIAKAGQMLTLLVRHMFRTACNIECTSAV